MSELTNLHEGTVVAIDLEDSRYAVGVLARVETENKKRSYGIFVYFFGPFSSIPISIFNEDDLLSRKPLARLKTSALDIYNGNWKIVGSVKPWNRHSWIFPEFYETNPLTGESYILRLDEADQITPISRRKITSVDNLDENILYGSEAARKKVLAISSGLQSLNL